MEFGEIVVTILWALAMFTALGVGIWELQVVRGDWRAVIESGIQNGRKMIARRNLWIMWLLVSIAVFNIIPVITLAVMMPLGLFDPSMSAIVNRTALLIGGWLFVAVILVKRSVRARWEAKHHHD